MKMNYNKNKIMKNKYNYKKRKMLRKKNRKNGNRK